MTSAGRYCVSPGRTRSRSSVRCRASVVLPDGGFGPGRPPPRACCLRPSCTRVGMEARAPRAVPRRGGHRPDDHDLRAGEETVPGAPSDGLAIRGSRDSGGEGRHWGPGGAKDQPPVHQPRARQQIVDPVRLPRAGSRETGDRSPSGRTGHRKPRQPAQCGCSPRRALRLPPARGRQPVERRSRRLPRSVPLRQGASEPARTRGGKGEAQAPRRTVDRPGSGQGVEHPQEVDPGGAAQHACRGGTVCVSRRMARGNPPRCGGVIHRAEHSGVGVTVHRPRKLERGRSREKARRRRAKAGRNAAGPAASSAGLLTT